MPATRTSVPSLLLATALIGYALMPATPAQAQDTASSPFTIFMQVRTTDAFLAMPPQERLDWVETDVVPILADHPGVKLRFFDSEFYSAEVSDVLVWEAASLDEYQAVVEGLRETKFWGPYFEVRSIVPARENAFADFYGPSGIVAD